MGSPHPYGHSDAHLPGRAIYQPVMLSKRFLIQSTDGGWRFFTAPQSLSNITQAGHVHFDESFFNVTFLEAIQLNDNGLKGDSSSLSSLLITTSFRCTIFSVLYLAEHQICCLLSKGSVMTLVYQSSANYVFFYPLFNSRNLILNLSHFARS